MSNNLNLALRLAYDGKAVTTGAQRNVRDLNAIPSAIRTQVAANDRLSVSQQGIMRQQATMTQSLGGLQRAYSGVGAAVTAAVSIGTASMFVRDTGSAQLLDQRIKGLTNSTKEYNDTQSYLFATSDRLNTKYDTLANSYSKILNLQQVGIVTQTQGKAILEGMANAAAKTGASNVQLEQSLFGMTQGMTAGVLRAEELNQVTEPLPGLLQKLDKAAGLASGGFRKLVVDGQVTSQMFKSTLVKALDSYAGAAEATQGKINASFAELSTEYQRMIREFETPVNFAVTSVVDSLSSGMAELRENQELVDSLTTSATALALVYGGGLVTSLGKSSIAYGANVVAKNKALASDVALAAQAKRSATQDLQYAIQQQAAATRQLTMASNTQLRTAAIKNLAIANSRLAATEEAVAVATNQHTAAAVRANAAVRLLRGSMALLGGPVGVAMLAAYSIYEFTKSSEQAATPTKNLKKYVYDLSSAFDTLNNQSAQNQVRNNSNKIGVITANITRARNEINSLTKLQNDSLSFDQRGNHVYAQKVNGLKSYVNEQVKVRASLLENSNEIANFEANLDKIDWNNSLNNNKPAAVAAPTTLPQNIQQLELSLQGEEARLKASIDKKRDMVIRASESDVANKTKYDAILTALDEKYKTDVIALNEKREDEKRRIQNTAEEARKNDLNTAFETKLAIIKGHSSREEQAAYNNELRIEQAKQQARIDGARRESLGLDANDELGEVQINADNQINQQQRQQDILNAQGFRTQEEANEAAHQERLFQIKNKYAGSLQSNIVAFANFEKKTQLEKTNAVVGLGAAAFKTMAGQSKTAFKAYKVMAIAQAMINTYQSATAAYASLAPIPVVGPALGVAAAAAAVFSGLAQVRSIKAQQPSGIAHGGMDYVPNESTYLLQRGERVLSPKQNVEISEAARRVNAGASAVGSGGGNLSFSITNQINVSGDTTPENATQIGTDIGRQIESYVVQNINSNGSIIRAVRAA